MRDDKGVRSVERPSSVGDAVMNYSRSVCGSDVPRVIRERERGGQGLHGQGDGAVVAFLPSYQPGP